MSYPPKNLFQSQSARLLHNGTYETDDVYTAQSPQWSYAVSFPIRLEPAPNPDLEPAVEVEVQVIMGAIGVGIMDEQLQHFVTSEADAQVLGRPARIVLRPGPQAASRHLMLRNTAPAGTSVFRVIGATLRFEPVERRLLAPTASPRVSQLVHAPNPVSGCFDVIVSHSSRSWNAPQCDGEYLRQRYARPDRLADLPDFEALVPNTAPYHGLLSIFHIDLTPRTVSAEITEHYASPEKVVHAAVVGDEIVVCFDGGVAVFARDRSKPGMALVPESVERIEDPWFGGLHTVVAESDRTCLVSSSGADAILWVDVPGRQVVRRWRLPSERYGSNYALDESTWLRDHYIPNDLQLGHLNCAAPDGAGGSYFSVLGQGDVGRLHASGRMELLVTGHVGCHGVRSDARGIYFSDSCRGQLVQVNGPGNAAPLFESGSLWLHDAIRLSGSLFLLALGDRNRLLLVDTDRQEVIAEWDFTEVKGTVQFLSLAGKQGC